MVAVACAICLASGFVAGWYGRAVAEYVRESAGWVLARR